MQQPAKVRFPEADWQRMHSYIAGIEEKAKIVLESLKKRMNQCKLELHPEKCGWCIAETL